MTLSPDEPNREAPPSGFRSGAARLRRWLAWFTLAALLLLGLLGWPLFNELLWGSLRGRAASPQIQLATATSSLQSEITGTPSPTPPGTEEFKEDETTPESETESVFISLSEAGYSHLYLYYLKDHQLSPLNKGEWEDIHPMLSPDGQRLAFASNRGSHWDLYTLGLEEGDIKQISDDLAYEASPSWSFDGSWLAYERYENQNLDIFIRPMDGSVKPVRITTQAGVDFSPAWSPRTQQIAFVSDRAGLNQIWLVDLSANSEDRFQQLFPGVAQKDPVWSPDGNFLAWSALESGLWRVYTLDVNDPKASPRLIGMGEQPAWRQDGEGIFAVVRSPNENYLTAYRLDGGLAMALEALPGQVEGLSWAAGMETEKIPPALISEDNNEDEKSWLTPPQIDLEDRQELLPLSNVDAPYAQLNSLVVAHFDALRARSAQALGWDLLSNLENAYLPLNVPQPPDRQRDWLYTGRAFSLNEDLLAADWMTLVREDFAGETYWRVFVRTAQQDGSYGRPMLEASWDFDARFSGENGDYQAGGRLSENVHSGYWLDFTQLVADFAWDRLPALSNWRSYYQGALFNEFAVRQNLSWEEAMLQIYPPEVLSGP